MVSLIWERSSAKTLDALSQKINHPHNHYHRGMICIIIGDNNVPGKRLRTLLQIYARLSSLLECGYVACAHQDQKGERSSPYSPGQPPAGKWWQKIYMAVDTANTSRAHKAPITGQNFLFLALESNHGFDACVHDCWFHLQSRRILFCGKCYMIYDIFPPQSNSQEKLTGLAVTRRISSRSKASRAYCDCCTACWCCSLYGLMRAAAAQSAKMLLPILCIPISIFSSRYRAAGHSL